MLQRQLLLGKWGLASFQTMALVSRFISPDCASHMWSNSITVRTELETSCPARVRTRMWWDSQGTKSSHYSFAQSLNQMLSTSLAAQPHPLTQPTYTEDYWGAQTAGYDRHSEPICLGSGMQQARNPQAAVQTRVLGYLAVISTVCLKMLIND